MNKTSWSVHIEGTAAEISAQVHEHEVHYWLHMPLAERLAVHHLVGHAVEHMREDGKGDPEARWQLDGSGHETEPGHGRYGGNHRVEWGPAPPLTEPAAPAPPAVPEVQESS